MGGAALGGILTWAAASRPLAGQTACGDAHLALAFPGGVLLAVVDGLGHGTEAEQAAFEAVMTLSESPSDPMSRLFIRCHEALRKTRGAVMSVATISMKDGSMHWAGVGNVEGVLARAGASGGRERLFVSGGIVGQNLPRVRDSSTTLLPGDVVALATDGIRSSFDQELRQTVAPEELANRILRLHGNDSDDALILVVRFLGTAA